MQLFTRRAAQALFPNQRLQRWCFDVELLFLAARLRIPVAETAVTWTEIPGVNPTAPGNLLEHASSVAPTTASVGLEAGLTQNSC